MINDKTTMNKTRLLVSDLKRGYKAVQKEVDQAVRRVLKSGWYILGKEVEAFESEFARYIGSRYAIGVASGTEAIQIALMALAVGEGDEVITSVNTAIPTAMAVISAGARPRFVDVEEETLNMSADSLAKAITRKTKAIIPVHLYGNPCDMDKIPRIARAHRIVVVEDCAQAHGAVYKGRYVGTFGDIGAFSFYPTKNLGCCGDGGAIVTNDKTLAKRIKLLRNYGQSTRYTCEIDGINSRLDEIQAAILRIKLKHLSRYIHRRIEIALIYNRLLKDIQEVITPASRAGSRHSFHLYVIRCARRDELRDFLLRRGIETQVHYPIPLHLQKAFKDLGYKKGDFPVSEMLSREVLSLPIFPEMKNAEATMVCEGIRDFYRRR